jgi:peptidoglycan-associated lipoprotein
MRIYTAMLALLLLSAMLPVCTTAAAAQDVAKAEVALTYTWAHANAPPESCGCFSLNGGSAVFAYSFSRSISAVAEAGAATNGNVDSAGRGITLSDYFGGLRYTPRSHAGVRPYGQLLLGIAHASGPLAPSQIGLGSATSFAMSTGGGVDFILNEHFAIRALQADYLLTLLSNRTNDRQNNFRLSTGLVFRFGK